MAWLELCAVKHFSVTSVLLYNLQSMQGACTCRSLVEIYSDAHSSLGISLEPLVETDAFILKALRISSSGHCLPEDG